MMPISPPTTRRRWGRRILVLAALVAPVAICPWPHPGVAISGPPCGDAPWWDLSHKLIAYIWASHLERQWASAEPQTRGQLEQYLSLHSVRQITPAQSCWGSRRKLTSGETMVQYLILWHAPLDVVYDQGGTIRSIYTSYE